MLYKNMHRYAGDRRVRERYAQYGASMESGQLTTWFLNGDSMTKSITLELPDWANWITQDDHGHVRAWELSPNLIESGFDSNGRDRFIHRGAPRNWENIKINLNTHGAYIDADGILHRCELVPDMLRRQA